MRREGMMAIEAHIEQPQESSIFQKYPKVLADHHMLDFITDCLRLIVGGNMAPHELEIAAGIRAGNAPPRSAGARAFGAEGGRRAAGLRHRGRGAGHHQHDVDRRQRGAVGDRREGRRPRWSARSSASCISYGFVGPIASAMENRAHEDGKAFEVVKMALIASLRGYAPQRGDRIRAQAAVLRRAPELPGPRSATSRRAKG